MYLPQCAVAMFAPDRERRTAPVKSACSSSTLRTAHNNSSYIRSHHMRASELLLHDTREGFHCPLLFWVKVHYIKYSSDQSFSWIENYEAASGCDKTQAGSQSRHHWTASIRDFSSYLQKYWFFYLVFIYTESSFIFTIHLFTRSDEH